MCLAGFAPVLYFGNDILIQFESHAKSEIVRVDGHEQVRNAKRLPSSGVNFATYSHVLSTIGRTHVHSSLRPVILETYKRLEKSLPQITWVYGETGWKNGGKFWPHRTHQNGLSVDFIIPVVDVNGGDARVLPLSIFNAFGYETRFNEDGVSGTHRIDFKSIAAHLQTLREVSIKYGLRIKRVIFDPALVELLSKEAIRQNVDLPFMKQKAWFPHDSHYHVDFEIFSNS